MNEARVVDTSTRMRWVLGAVIAAFACWCFAAGLRANRCAIVDDAFITYRFADHLRLGHGLVWNIGERPVEGASNLSMVLLLALFGGWFAAPSIAFFVGTASALLTSLAIYLAVRDRVTTAAAWFCAGVYLVLPAIAVHARAGLETNLYTCALAWFALALERFADAPHLKRGLMAGAAYAAAMLCRPEAGMVAGVGIVTLLARELLTRRESEGARRVFLFGVSCAALLGAFLFWKLAYFGTLLSPPYLVKANTGRLLPGAGVAIIFVFRYGGAWLAAVVGAARARTHPASWICAGIALANTLFFSFTEPLVAFHSRYLVPALPLLLIVGAPVIEALLALIPKRGQLVLVPLSLVLVAPSVLQSADMRLIEIKRFLMLSPVQQCEDTWTGRDRQLAQRIARIDPDGKLRIVAEDVGAIGYASRAYVLDPIGLTNEAVARSATPRQLADLVFKSAPDLIMLRMMVDPNAQPIENGHGALGRFGKGTLLDDNRFTDFREIASGPAGDSAYRWHAWMNVHSAMAPKLSAIAGFESEALLP